MCLYSAKKKRDTTMLVKTIVLTISYKEKKARRKKGKDIVIFFCVLLYLEYDRQLDTYISHDDIRLDSSIFEKFIDIIIIKLKILNKNESRFKIYLRKMNLYNVIMLSLYTRNNI